MVCRVIDNENNTTRQPRSQTGVEGGQKEEGCRGILPFRRQALLRSRYAFFKATVLILESYGGLGDISKHDYKLPYFDIQRNIQKGLVGIGNRFAARARDWKEIQNAQG